MVEHRAHNPFVKGSSPLPTTRGSYERIFRNTFKWKYLRKRKTIERWSSFETQKKIATNNGIGYLQVKIEVDRQSKRYYVHRLVAETFIPNPNNYPDVNHIDGDKSNNDISNLEWCSRKDNIKHAINNNLINRDNQGRFI